MSPVDGPGKVKVVKSTVDRIYQDVPENPVPPNSHLSIVCFSTRESKDLPCVHIPADLDAFLLCPERTRTRTATVPEDTTVPIEKTVLRLRLRGLSIPSFLTDAEVQYDYRTLPPSS